MTDEEIGAGGAAGSWDGVPGPQVVSAGGQRVVEYATFTHVDYVRNARDNPFSLARTGMVDTRRYTARVLATARAYLAVGVPIAAPARKRRWNILSFKVVAAADDELATALKQANVAASSLGSDVFRFELYQPVAVGAQPSDHRKTHVGISASTTLYVGATSTVLVRTGSGSFRPKVVDV